MHVPEHGLENGPENIEEYFPMRAMSAQEQTVLDTMIAKEGKDFGYFVSFDRHGGPCPNSVHGVNYPTNR